MRKFLSCLIAISLCIMIISGCTPKDDYSEQKNHIQALAFEKLNEKYDLDLTPDDFTITFTTKDENNTYQAFGKLTADKTVYIYGSKKTPEVDVEEFYAVYNMSQDEIIECELM